MSAWKLMLMGLGITGLGVFNIFWTVIKVISCIMIAGYISIRAFHLSGLYWWFSSIILYCILAKIVFFGNNNEAYGDMVEKYNGKVEEELNYVK